MFTKVLIADDHDHVNISVRRTLEDLGITNKEIRSYCDDAFDSLSGALKKDQPFDLLITDLSFEEDKNIQEIKSGKELAKAAKALQPDLKVIVFSLENNLDTIDELFDEIGIDAYVRKARYDADDLKNAIKAVLNHKKYRSADLIRRRRTDNSYDFKIVDIEIISQLCSGVPQKNIPAYLQEKNIKPSGLSSIEKRLNAIKTALNITSNEQLIAYCKDKKII